MPKSAAVLRKPARAAAKTGAPINPRVAVLAYEGLCAFEFSCAAEVFGLARPELTRERLGRDWYRFETCAAQRRPLRGQYGLKIQADAGLDRLARAGTVIVPGWSGSDTPVPAAIVDALREAHARGARLLSICSGVLVLAATGLLDGRRATTHWRYLETLRERYPRIRIDANALYVDEGRLLTSAGSAAGLDLCLHLVRRDWGPRIANHVARRLVIAPHREGGQAQYIERPVQRSERGALAPLLDDMRRRLAEPLTIAELARIAAMSERSFMRHFKQATGATPADWLIQARVERARELLETTPASIDRIAGETGFGSAITMRHHFRRKLGVSPRDYRRRFARERG
ncbi:MULTISPECIES: transcriptional regulator FtrA [unclassified Lysobacter]|uniref:transcriptional regulator FtrA n=1 Tax=unclassified Lysobacter TaxID=2635362 RepID=UPI001BE84845|nr:MULTISPECIES: transcriptional regulator FtrA [unclassified Lysobacter]MBT2745578.1 transcriptional regulator FtrA [Lysobacter sp. ISL-42]MBT2753517.1 transcriptional regulator FtrA [Lysobacter sp. ISL-50]MBT2777099.1 transcriptional regulator FtrA [Lysobacter sp. ISL-54]MBT2780275.1 transcriptional regulator FtrA [Lysobacter sp. ISL-52]